MKLFVSRLILVFLVFSTRISGSTTTSSASTTTTSATSTSSTSETTTSSTSENSTSSSSSSNSTESVDPDDLLQGRGFFYSKSIGDWVLNSSELIYEFEEVTGTEEYCLLLEKHTTAELSFRDGLILSFNTSKPKHVRFYFAPSYVDSENTNLRLKNSKTDKTALSFRCGNAGFLRVNDNQMVDFYNDTLSTKTNIIWSKMDLILNWEDQEVRIYLNETFKGTSSFYHPDVTEVDTLMLYNLKPGTFGFWRGLQVCESKCENFSYGEGLKTGFLMILMMVSLLILI